jgi:penicillin-binding protein 2
MANGLTLKNRRLLFQALILAGAIFLVGRLVYLQVFRSEHYRRLSQENRMRVTPEPARRGIIVDRNGVELAGNRPSFVISVVPREIRRHSGVLQRLAARLNNDVVELQQKVRAGRSMPYWPVTIQRDVDFRSICYFEEHIEQFPGVLFQTAAVRRYIPGKWTGNVLGYTREVTARDMARKQTPGLRPGSYIGAAGIEKEHDQHLRGADGLRYLEVSALGRVIGSMPGVADKPSVAGSVTMLTIDNDLQELADSLLAEYGSGVVIAIEPASGEILCFINRPGFSANLFSGIMPQDQWNQLLADSLRPLMNRATKGLYPPGSVAKLWTAGAALETGTIDEHTTFAPCYGGLQIGNRYFRCHKASGHGKLSLVDAIAQSCDVYFYQVGLKLGIADWAEYTAGCGFGRETDIDLPDEDPGLVPDIDYYDRRYGKRGWTKTLAVNLAIGQGELLTTPLQVAQFIAGLANRGKVMRPHLLRAYQAPGRSWEMQEPESSFEFPFAQKTIDLLIKGARAVVEDDNGTAHWLADKRYAMAGKTGTDQNPHGNEHAWFAAFAPVDKPLIAVVVLAENAGHGSVAAAPIARDIIEAYFKKYFPSILSQPVVDSLPPSPITVAEPIGPR